MHTNNQLTTWPAFIAALSTRFGPSSYENHEQLLFKLQQTITVSEYQSRFEKLCNQVVGLRPASILNCFISGLNEEIKKEMSTDKPTTVSEAIGLAKLYESKFKDTKTTNSRFPRSTSYQYTPTHTQKPYTPYQHASTTTLPTTQPKP